MYVLREGPLAATLTVYRGRWSAPFGEPERRTAARIGPHLARAVQIHRKLAGVTAERDMMFDAMERLAVGAVFIAGDARILTMNQAAREMTAEGDGLANENGGLAGNTATSTRRLRQAIASALRPGVEAPQRVELAIDRPSGKRPYVVVASPMRTRLSLAVSARALILITDTDRTIPGKAEALQRIYSLTPAEAALAVALCEGRTVKEIALSRNVSTNTIHTQLMNVQRKVGTNRQAEIVSVLMRGPLGILRRDPFDR